jgi:hypothetical protein
VIQDTRKDQKEEAAMTDDARLKKVAEQHIRRFTLLYYFMTREIVETLGEEKGKDLIRKAVKRFGEARGKAIRERVKKDGLDADLKNFKSYYDLPLGLTHKSTLVKASTEKRNWKEVRGCLFSEIIKELGAEELGALFCEQDQALAEAYNPRIRFTRFKTALTGDDCCETLTELI